MAKLAKSSAYRRTHFFRNLFGFSLVGMLYLPLVYVVPTLGGVAVSAAAAFFSLYGIRQSYRKYFVGRQEDILGKGMRNYLILLTAGSASLMSMMGPQVFAFVGTLMGISLFAGLLHFFPKWKFNFAEDKGKFWNSMSTAGIYLLAPSSAVLSLAMFTLLTSPALFFYVPLIVPATSSVLFFSYVSTALWSTYEEYRHDSLKSHLTGYPQHVGDGFKNFPEEGDGQISFPQYRPGLAPQGEAPEVDGVRPPI